MTCPHQPNDWMKCPDCATKAVVEQLKEKTDETIEKYREMAKEISRLNKAINGRKL